MHYTVLNLKIADEQLQSLCGIEMIEMHDKHILHKKSWLIHPEVLYISPMCYKRYHLKASELIDAPYLPEVWPDILPYLQCKVILCHKAIGMISILLKALDSYGLDYPRCEIGCTLMISKRLYPHLTNHHLNHLKTHIDSTHSLEDEMSEIDLMVLLMSKVIDTLNCTTLSQLLDQLQLQLGEINPQLSIPIIWPSFIGSLSDKLLLPNESIPLVPPHPLTNLPYSFLGKVVCLTGPLESMVRIDAVKKLHALGATYSSSVTRQTNVVLTNVKNPELLPLESLTSKLRRALILKAQGQSIDIIHEETFLQAIEALKE